MIEKSFLAIGNELCLKRYFLPSQIKVLLPIGLRESFWQYTRIIFRYDKQVFESMLLCIISYIHSYFGSDMHCRHKVMHLHISEVFSNYLGVCLCINSLWLALLQTFCLCWIINIPPCNKLTTPHQQQKITSMTLCAFLKHADKHLHFYPEDLHVWHLQSSHRLSSASILKSCIQCMSQTTHKKKACANKTVPTFGTRTIFISPEPKAQGELLWLVFVCSLSMRPLTFSSNNSSTWTTGPYLKKLHMNAPHDAPFQNYTPLSRRTPRALDKKSFKGHMHLLLNHWPKFKIASQNCSV